MTMLIIFVSALILLIVASVRSDVVYGNHKIIIEAIEDYHLWLIQNDKYEFNECDVEYADMEDYTTTFLRFWDWGYSRILPPEKLEIVKPYIGGGER